MADRPVTDFRIIDRQSTTTPSQHPVLFIAGIKPVCQKSSRLLPSKATLCVTPSVPPFTPDLLEETEKLMAEKVEVQRQAEKESLDLLHQVKTLEAELEEQVNRVIELEHARKTETGDLLQQIQALEKQLEKNRRFLDVRDRGEGKDAWLYGWIWIEMGKMDEWGEREGWMGEDHRKSII